VNCSGLPVGALSGYSVDLVDLVSRARLAFRAKRDDIVRHSLSSRHRLVVYKIGQGSEIKASQLSTGAHGGNPIETNIILMTA
jgi:hypothetical protein